MALAQYYNFVRFGRDGYRYRRVRRGVAAGGRARLDGAGLHAAPNADHVQIMRALGIVEACETLKQRGGLHALDRQRVKTGVGY